MVRSRVKNLLHNEYQNPQYQNEILRDYASSFSAEAYRSNGYFLHFHRNLELYGVVNGSVYVTVAGESRRLESGQMAVIDQMETHGYEIDGEADILFFNIGTRYLGSFHRLYPDRRLPRWLEDADYNRRIFADIQPVLGVDPTTVPELLRIGLVCSLFSDIIDRYGLIESSQLSKNDTELTTRVIQYIYDHYSEALTLERLAEQFNISPKLLSRKMSKALGMDLRIFVSDVRVQKAVELMENPEYEGKSLNEIIALSGFNSTHTFYRSYKRNFKNHKLTGEERLPKNEP